MNSPLGKLPLLSILLFSIPTLAQSPPGPSTGQKTLPRIVQADLTVPGSTPFHLKATITEHGDPTAKVEVEIFWLAPDKWRRTIQSQDFSQKLIVNGDRIFEEDSEDYFPLGLQTLVTAMIDPKPVLRAFRPGDRLMTFASGAAGESGVVCDQPNNKLCAHSPFGLIETVGAPGRSVDFARYQDFKGKRVARLLVYGIDAGNSLKAEVRELKELKNPAPELFAVEKPTPRDRRIQAAVLPEAELRGLALETPEIIWPQVLDGATTGKAGYYVSVDRSGQVRETLPLNSANERANDSARRQIEKWKFKPAVKDGVSVQAESILNFDLNTRAWGPTSPLSDAEARKLASSTVEPVIPPGTAPRGSTYTLWVAVDHQGNVIEIIPGDGPSNLFLPCFKALKEWRFNPYMQEGKPRPYRAQITFQVP